MKSWREAGLSDVVSLLTSEEAAELDLGDEAEQCRSTGLAFTPFPMPDRGVPASEKEAAAAFEKILAALREGKAVALSPAGSLLGLAGEKTDVALKKASGASPSPSPPSCETGCGASSR